jgi:hypothetical protein
MLQNIIATLIVMVVWFEIYQVPSWNKYLKKKPFGCEYCLPVYAYLIISILPIYIKEIIIGTFLSVILFQLIIKFIRK